MTGADPVVVQPGSPMIEIVPRDDSLLIEMRLRPADIAFVRVGQRAVVKVTAYGYSIFGGLEGRIEHVSADSTVPQQGDPFYVAHVRTASNGTSTTEKNSPSAPGCWRRWMSLRASDRCCITSASRSTGRGNAL